jgi:hypothetical protein
VWIHRRIIIAAIASCSVRIFWAKHNLGLSQTAVHYQRWLTSVLQEPFRDDGDILELFLVDFAIGNGVVLVLNLSGVVECQL